MDLTERIYINITTSTTISSSISRESTNRKKHEGEWEVKKKGKVSQQTGENLQKNTWTELEEVAVNHKYSAIFPRFSVVLHSYCLLLSFFFIFFLGISLFMIKVVSLRTVLNCSVMSWERTIFPSFSFLFPIFWAHFRSALHRFFVLDSVCLSSSSSLAYSFLLILCFLELHSIRLQRLESLSSLFSFASPSFLRSHEPKSKEWNEWSRKNNVSIKRNWERRQERAKEWKDPHILYIQDSRDTKRTKKRVTEYYVTQEMRERRTFQSLSMQEENVMLRERTSSFVVLLLFRLDCKWCCRHLLLCHEEDPQIR